MTTTIIQVKPMKALSPNGKASCTMKPKIALPSLVSEIRELQRQRVAFQKSRIKIDNRLVANVATTRGYHAGMEDNERAEHFDAARKIIEGVKGDRPCETESGDALAPLINSVGLARDAFFAYEKGIEAEMERLAKQLPVYPWLKRTDQRGLGLLSLAIIIGEAGDLSNYDNPGKLWRRMGCAPIESKGVMHMGSTWRSRKRENGGLSAAEWEDAGYSPRRRSVMYVIAESLLKGNSERIANPETGRKAMPAGPYRQRYDLKKAEAIARNDPAWTPPCTTCKGTGKTKAGAECKKCGGRGYMQMRPHLHGMLLAGKLLLRELWTEWQYVVDGVEPEPWRQQP